jgi:hypothetical protein
MAHILRPETSRPVQYDYSAACCVWMKILMFIRHSYSGPVGRESVVGIATRYELEGPGIQSRWGGEIFRTRPHRPWGPPSLLYSGYRANPEGKSTKAWRWSSTPSSAEVKERVELYLYSPYGLHGLF